MPGQHKEPTITFRPSVWEKAIIDQRITLSGMRKKDFIVRSCIYSNIVVVGKKENIQRIADALWEMQMVMKEIAGQIQSGDFSLTDNSYQELKNDYLAFTTTLVDIMNGAAYLFEKQPLQNQRDWKAELELEQYRNILKPEENKSDQKEKRDTD